MNLVESFRIALRALNANKVRSALTMLGVIIGVAAVIMLVAIGTGVQDEVTGQSKGSARTCSSPSPANFEGGGGGGGGGSITQAVRHSTTPSVLERRLGDPDDVVVPVVQIPATIKVGNRTMRTTIAAGNEFTATRSSRPTTSAVAGTTTGARSTRPRGSSRSARPCATSCSRCQDPVGQTVNVNGQRSR